MTGDKLPPNDDRRRRNRRLGLGVLGVMLTVAAVTTAFVLATTDYRRSVDTVRHDLPRLWVGATVAAGATMLAAVVGVAVASWRRRP